MNTSTVRPNQVWLGNLPENPVEIPGLYIPPGMEQMAFFAAGYFLHYLSINSTRNAGRTFLFNKLTENGLSNNDIVDAVTLTMNYALLLKTKAGDRSNENRQYAMQAAEEVASMLTAVYSQRYGVRVISNNPNSLTDALQRYDYVQNELSMFMKTGGIPMSYHNQQVPPQYQQNQQMSPAQGYPAPGYPGQGYPPGYGNQPPPPPGYGNHPPQYYDPRFAQHPSAGYGNNQQVPQGGYGVPPQQPQQFGNQPPQMPQATNWNTGPSSFSTPQNNNAGNWNQQNVQPPTNNADRKYGQLAGNNDNAFKAFDVRAQQQQTTQQVNNQPQNNNNEVNQQPSRATVNIPYGRPDEEDENFLYYYDRGDGLIRKSFDIEDPEPHAYNPATHIKVFVVDKATKIVKEVFRRKEINMNYSEHEIESNVLNRTGIRENGKVIPNEELLIKTQEVKEDTPIEDIEHILDNGRLVTSGKMFYTSSRTAADVLTRSYLYAKGLRALNSNGYEFKYNKVTPYTDITDEKEVENKVQQIFSANDLNDFVYKLKIFSKDKTFPEDLLGDMVERSTEVLNETLSTGLGLDWSISSILLDWKDLTDEFEEEFGSETGISYLQLIESKARRSIITGNMTLLSGSEKSKVINKTFSKEVREEASMEDERTLIFVETKSITRIPQTAQELNLRLENGRGAISEKDLNGLYRLIKGMDDRHNTNVKRIVPMLIKTRDGKLLSVHKGILNSNYYVIKDCTFS